MDIKVEERQTQAGVFYTVHIGGVTIYDCRRMTGTSAKGPYDFISGPQRKGKDRDGKDKWFAQVKFDDVINAAIIAEIDGAAGDGPGFDPDLDVPF